jgi:hypothetical protein
VNAPSGPSNNKYILYKFFRYFISTIIQTITVPLQLSERLRTVGDDGRYVNYGNKKGKFSVEEIKSWFEFETEELESKLYAEFDKLKEYECIDTEIIRNNNTIEDIITAKRNSRHATLFIKMRRHNVRTTNS